MKDKFQTEGNLAVIYRVDNLLLFYSKDKDPQFTKGYELTAEEADQSEPYKAIKYDAQSVPGDAFPDLAFTWS